MISGGISETEEEEKKSEEQQREYYGQRKEKEKEVLHRVAHISCSPWRTHTGADGYS